MMVLKKPFFSFNFTFYFRYSTYLSLTLCNLTFYAIYDDKISFKLLFLIEAFRVVSQIIRSSWNFLFQVFESFALSLSLWVEGFDICSSICSVAAHLESSDRSQTQWYYLWTFFVWDSEWVDSYQRWKLLWKVLLKFSTQKLQIIVYLTLGSLQL